MANYDKIKKVAQEMNIVGGALHPKCIYLIAANDYDPKIHGSEYSEWDYPFKFHLYLYAPKRDNKGDEWSGKRYLCLKGMTKVISLAKEPIDFLGYLHDGNVITHKNAKTGADGVQWDEKVIPTNFSITDTATIGYHIYALSSSSQIFKRMIDTQWEVVHQPVKKTHKGKAANTGFFCK